MDAERKARIAEAEAELDRMVAEGWLRKIEQGDGSVVYEDADPVATRLLQMVEAGVLAMDGEDPHTAMFSHTGLFAEWEASGLELEEWVERRRAACS